LVNAETAVNQAMVGEAGRRDRLQRHQFAVGVIILRQDQVQNVPFEVS